MSSVVVHDEMKFCLVVVRNSIVYEFEKLEEFLLPMALVAVAYDFPSSSIIGSE